MISPTYYERRILPNNIFPFHDIEKAYAGLLTEIGGTSETPIMKEVDKEETGYERIEIPFNNFFIWDEEVSKWLSTKEIEFPKPIKDWGMVVGLAFFVNNESDEFYIADVFQNS
jgi:hypothetical protein|nr:MAG TPA: hypothetical protein [Caudoviricetes sp.]